MANKQSRRGVSLSEVTYQASAKAARAQGITLSELVTRSLRAAGVDIPEQSHRSVESAAKAVAARTAPKVTTPKPLPLRKGPLRAAKRNAIPSAPDLDALMRECRRGVSNLYHSDPSQREAAKRRVSIRFAHEMRKRGWLAEEGYAEASWADPKNQRRSA